MRPSGAVVAAQCAPPVKQVAADNSTQVLPIRPLGWPPVAQDRSTVAIAPPLRAANPETPAQRIQRVPIHAGAPMNVHPVAHRRALPRRLVLFDRPRSGSGRRRLSFTRYRCRIAECRFRTGEREDHGLANAADAPAPSKAPSAPPQPTAPPAPAAIPVPEKSGTATDAAAPQAGATDQAARDGVPPSELHESEITIDEKGIRIEKASGTGKRTRHVVVRGADGDSEFDSFDALRRASSPGSSRSRSGRSHCSSSSRWPSLASSSGTRCGAREC